MGYQKRCLQVHVFISSAGNEVAGIYVGAHSRIPQPSGRNISSRPDYGDWSRLVFGVTGPQMDDEYLSKVTRVRDFFVPWISPSPHIHSGSLINLMCIQMQSGQNGAVCRRRIASHCPLRRQLEEPFLYDIHCIHSVYLYIVGRGRLKNPSACISITPCLGRLPTRDRMETDHLHVMHVLGLIVLVRFFYTKPSLKVSSWNLHWRLVHDAFIEG